jgi:hypothetical protein
VNLFSYLLTFCVFSLFALLICADEGGVLPDSCLQAAPHPRHAQTAKLVAKDYLAAGPEKWSHRCMLPPLVLSLFFIYLLSLCCLFRLAVLLLHWFLIL